MRTPEQELIPNEILEKLAPQFKNDGIDPILEGLIQQDFLVFLLEKWRISSGESQGAKYSFKERPYLLGIAQDKFWWKVVEKSAQCGVSEMFVAMAVWIAIHRKMNVLYTMPAGEQMQQFVDARARNAIVTSDYFTQFVTGTLNLKKFSLNHRQIYFRGAQKRRQIITMDVSALLADEADEYEEGVLTTLDKRLGASKNPIKVYFSTPSFHGTGVSLYYYGSETQGERGSDQRVWSIKCDSCGKWNEDLLWEENVVDLNANESKLSSYTPNVIVICRHCKKPLDRLSTNAEWIPKVTANSDHCHGYHVSKLFSPIANLNQMFLDSKSPLKEQEFWNSDLGLPYEPKGSKLTESIIDNCRDPERPSVRTSKEFNALGVDIGVKIHAIAGNMASDGTIKIISVQEFDNWEELRLFARDINAKITVIDMNPEKEEAVSFQKEHHGVSLAYYAQFLERTPEKIKRDLEHGTVAIHRTLMMMLVSDLFVNRQISLPADIRRVRDFYLHLSAPIKAQKQDVRGDWVTFYPKTKNPDHYYHALLYLVAALSIKSKPAMFQIIKTMMH